MKVSLILNAYIGPGVKGGAGAEGYQLAVDLYRRNILGKVFCYGIGNNTPLPESMVVPFCSPGIMSASLRTLTSATKRYPRLRARRIIEQWMDKHYCQYLDQAAGDVIYSPKPLYPRTFAKARKHGIKIVVETSVLHPRYNLDVVTEERKRLNLRGACGYTDSVRVKYIEDALEKADHIIAWSHFIRDSYVKYGVSENKIVAGGKECEPPGVDMERFQPQQRDNNHRFVVLHMSSITVIKGVQYLLEAWQKVSRKIKGELSIVGMLDKDMRTIRRRDSQPGVKWIGPTTDPEVYYNNASVFVSPSLSDAGPRTVLESMACGVPAIISDRCGISTSIDNGRNGFIYHYNDVRRLAELIEWSYMNRDKLKIMGSEALDTVKKYSVKNYSADVCDRIYTLIK